MDKNDLFKVLTKRANEILEGRLNRNEKLKAICKLLRDNVPYYNFVSFYIVDKKRKELVLGPFEGEPTEHVRIPFGVGICGQAAKLRKTFIVQDVTEETNYLSCSANVKAEIVIPIFHKNEVVGELDIDSHTLSPFTSEDTEFLEKIAEQAAELL
ncbi:GAF domain-containing protein [Candidatus Bathyarchaeota archaeon A05DMB-2]|jgi:GAF domain-containing protein|nr:GAF domain-containing protein [Candidatus Bathyarchaeota archaeon A05DMB-2]